MVLLAAMVGFRVFAPGRITTDRIMGAVALYLLFGVVWGNAYEIVALADPAAFNAAPDPGRGIERWFYFSFVTLTTVGYGDVTPVSRAARVLAIGEALVGQLYPAIILARLVTLQTSEPPARRPRPAAARAARRASDRALAVLPERRAQLALQRLAGRVARKVVQHQHAVDALVLRGDARVDPVAAARRPHGSCSRSTTAATGVSPHLSCGMPNTATSRTAGWCAAISSMSFG